MAAQLHVDEIDETAPVPAQLAAIHRVLRGIASDLHSVAQLVADTGLADMSKPERQALPTVIRDHLEARRSVRAFLAGATRTLAIAGGAVTITLQVLHR
jgi:hypothetical protein